MSVFMHRLVDFITMIERVETALRGVTRTEHPEVYDETAAMLNNIANEIQHSRGERRSANVPITPGELGMVDAIVSTIRSQARILESHPASGEGVKDSLNSLVNKIRNNPAFGEFDIIGGERVNLY